VIKKLILKGNITKTGKNAFSDCDNISSVTFENFAMKHDMKNFPDVGDMIERVLKGYRHWDIWKFTDWFSRQIPRMLQEIKQNKSFPPSEYSSINPEEWHKNVERMIFCLSEMTKTSYKNHTKMKAYRKKMKEEGFALLCNNFENLG
jgi:hypothetical protein